MAEPLYFEGCDSKTVLLDVTSKIASSAARSIWTPMLSELERAGVKAATSYLEEQFNKARDDLQLELQRLKAKG